MEQNKNEIKDFIKNEIKKKSELMQIELGTIQDDFSLTGSGVFDSMDFMTLIVDVENAFHKEVDFSDSDPEQFTTLGGFVDCVK
ncbi:acyl carrier protein [Psychroserpens mesophilus]|uniref:acyl carrier protein n=1 Tax=Psychroserpens mesophilus TaxID=325473 RepID=UPI00126A142C|nr:acyl carrier protein [Psychroserpens mesophilus]